MTLLLGNRIASTQMKEKKIYLLNLSRLALIQGHQLRNLAQV